MAIVSSLAVKGFLKKFGPFIAVAALVAVVLSLAYYQGKDAGANKEIVDQQERTIETQNRLGEASDDAAEQRVEDTITIEQQRRELQDAITNDEDAGVVRQRRGCLVMRQQGRDTSGIAACRRFESGG